MKRRISKRRFFSILLVAAAGIFLSGCNAAKSQLQTFNAIYQASDFENSRLFAEGMISDKNPPQGNDLLWSMQLASIERICSNHAKSTTHFDSAEDMIKYFDLQDSKAGDAIFAAAINDNAVPYKGQEYDGIMINTYKALNFMAIGNMDNARVEINRALDRQRRAREKFNQEIQKLEKALEDKNDTSKKNVENPEIKNIINEKYPNLNAFEAYPDFVNPFATYLAGVFLQAQGDYAKATDLIKETYGMMPDNEYLAQELVELEKGFADSKSRTNKVWVIFENGLSVEKQEFRIDIPLFIATNDIKYVGIALPKLEERQQAFSHLVVESQGRKFKTQTVADIDRVIQTEFEKEFPSILTRAIVSATGKAVAQYALQKNNSSFGAIMMAAYSFASTTADVRMWTTLPKDIQIATLTKPDNNHLTIQRPDSISYEIEIPDCNNAIVYVKAITAQTEPIIEVIKL